MNALKALRMPSWLGLRTHVITYRKKPKDFYKCRSIERSWHVSAKFDGRYWHQQAYRANEVHLCRYPGRSLAYPQSPYSPLRCTRSNVVAIISSPHVSIDLHMNRTIEMHEELCSIMLDLLGRKPLLYLSALSSQYFNPSQTKIEANKVHGLENLPWSNDLVSEILANSINHNRFCFSFQKCFIP